MTTSNNALWMPFTGNRAFHQDPRFVVAANGAYYIDDTGRRVFDGLSGLWCCGYGHARPEITAAVEQQLRTLDYSPAFQFGHPGEFEFAQRLVDLCPGNLNHVFFTNSGSETADTSLKMARAYWRLRGQGSKTRFIGRHRGYHGVNFAGTSLGGIGGNRKLFGQLGEADHLASTLQADAKFSRGQASTGADLADELDQLVTLHDASNIAAVIVEPWSGSGGVIIPPVGYLKRLRELCTQHDILLIFDEVITGFGRSAANFGADAFGVQPDMMNLAKALTNGTLPMGAVVVSSEIYNRFMEQDLPAHAVEFPHGYTYSGHPVACAAALASLDIFEQDNIVERAVSLAPVLEKAVHELRGFPNVTDIRNYGLAAAIEITPRAGDPTIRPQEVALACWQAGYYIRWSGDTLQLAPPMIATEQQIKDLCSNIADALRTTP